MRCYRIESSICSLNIFINKEILNIESKIEILISDVRLVFIQDRYEESLKLTNQAIKLDSQNADAHQCAANAYMSFGDYEMTF